MRNLKQHPPTEDEIVDVLERLRRDSIDGSSFGSFDAACLRAAIGIIKTAGELSRRAGETPRAVAQRPVIDRRRH